LYQCLDIGCVQVGGRGKYDGSFAAGVHLYGVRAIGVGDGSAVDQWNLCATDGQGFISAIFYAGDLEGQAIDRAAVSDGQDFARHRGAGGIARHAAKAVANVVDGRSGLGGTRTVHRFGFSQADTASAGGWSVVGVGVSRVVDEGLSISFAKAGRRVVTDSNATGTIDKNDAVSHAIDGGAKAVG